MLHNIDFNVILHPHCDSCHDPCVSPYEYNIISSDFEVTKFL